MPQNECKDLRFLAGCEGENRDRGKLRSLLWEIGQKTDSLGRWQISSSQIGRSGNYETQVPGRAGEARRRFRTTVSFQKDMGSFSGISRAGKLSEAFSRYIFMKNRVDYMTISCTWGFAHPRVIQQRPSKPEG